MIKLRQKGMVYMYCKICGFKYDENNAVCPNCSGKPESPSFETQEITNNGNYDSDNRTVYVTYENQQPPIKYSKKKVKLIAVAVVTALVVAIGAFAAYYFFFSSTPESLIDDLSDAVNSRNFDDFHELTVPEDAVNKIEKAFSKDTFEQMEFEDYKIKYIREMNLYNETIEAEKEKILKRHGIKKIEDVKVIKCKCEKTVPSFDDAIVYDDYLTIYKTDNTWYLFSDSFFN